MSIPLVFAMILFCYIIYLCSVPMCFSYHKYYLTSLTSFKKQSYFLLKATTKLEFKPNTVDKKW